MSLGPYTSFIVTSYTLVAAVVLILIGWIALDYRNQRARLRELEAAHVVKRRVVPGPPVRVDYELTPQGEELRLAIADVALWAEKWLPLEEAGGIQAPSSAAGV